ncbi:TolC family protein [Schlesneria sp. T3-172]|uniref:TolC family protein n=1 Tax=Schlesneria sphaerica TaxID=3373610 RepID=UPI0037C8B533
MLISSALVGCRTARPVSYLGDAELRDYVDRTTAIEYPIIEEQTSPDVVNTQRPHTVRDRHEDEVWDMSLMEAVHLAVQNNKLIRTRSNEQAILQAPGTAPSVYDPAIRDSGYLFGNRGVEAALADYDATFTSQMLFGHNEAVANTTIPYPGFVSRNDSANFTSSLAKTFATGGSLAFNNNWTYQGTNAVNPMFPSATLFPSNYVAVSQVQFVQPLWAGSGVEYNRIAGPARAGLTGVTGVSQGVAISRINTDISIADFENSVITMVKDVEDLYWELYLAYRQFAAESANRDSSLRTWREVKAKMDVGATGGNASNEAQARENYFNTRANVENAWGNILRTENAFRKLMGLPVNDGRIIRPADNPLEGEYLIQWESALIDGLTRRVELRKQKWAIKSLQLQVKAAENVINPQLNFISSYQLNGFGETLLSNSSSDGMTEKGYNSAYGALTRGDQSGWNVGLQFSMPIGFRAFRAQLHNLELQLVKARAGLAAQELDISHELADSIQKVDLAYMTARTHLDRKIASERRVQATTAEYEAGVRDATLDLVLRAQASNAAAEIAYYTSLVNYNKAITELHQRRGTLLENDGIRLAEGEWNTYAQQDAVRRAWARSFAFPAPNLKTLPPEYASPVPVDQTEVYPGAPAGFMGSGYMDSTQPDEYDEILPRPSDLDSGDPGDLPSPIGPNQIE